MIIAMCLLLKKNLIKNIKSIKNLIRKLFLLMDGVDILIKLRDICNCLILHPSELQSLEEDLLPQNQLVRNINKSAITILL